MRSSRRQSSSMVYKPNEWVGIAPEKLRLCSGFVRDAVQISLRFEDLLLERAREGFQVPVARIAKYASNCRIANGQSRRQCQNSIAKIVVTSAAEGSGPPNIGNIVAAVIEQAQETAESPQPFASVPKASSNFEHRAGILAGDLAPILYPK